ncbi:MAG: hypothetical protein AAGC47_13705, partial [Bacteroidota bacterium]
LKYLDGEQKAKLIKFMEIRNKFAHVSECVDFDSFSKYDNHIKALPKLEKWYSKNGKESSDVIETPLDWFTAMHTEIMEVLQGVTEAHLRGEAKEAGGVDFQLRLFDMILERMKNDESFKVVFQEESDKLKEEWQALAEEYAERKMKKFKTE